jgi:hypothetical protein
VSRNSDIDRKDLLAFNGMIITGMLFLLGLSSEITERKMILYLSVFPFFFLIMSSIPILFNKHLEFSKLNTATSLGILFVVLLLVFLDVVILDNAVSKYFETYPFGTNNNSSSITNNN